MTIKDSIQNLLTNLLSASQKGQINWEEKSTSVETTIEGVKIRYTISWQLSLANGYTMTNGYMVLKSTNYDITIYTSDYPEIFRDFKEHFQSFFEKSKPNEMPIVQEINEISKKISLEEYRQGKIDQIFGKNNL